jgi:hypothetical protein
MKLQAALCLLLAMAAAHASNERNLAPAVQGPYLVWKGELAVNPMSVGSYSALGWRERVYDSESPWLGYNFLGEEIFGDIHLNEISIGSRFLVHPNSFLSAALSYRLVCFPSGVASFEGKKSWDESDVKDELWHKNSLSFNTFGDEFSLKLSVHKDWGAWQGSIPLEWARLDIRDELRDSIYVPSWDLLSRSRDDFVKIAPMMGYRFDAPFLFGVGIAHTLSWTVDHDIASQRSGVWFHMWPFSARSSGEMRYWSLFTRLDLWSQNQYKQFQPRLELNLGWDRNLLQD